MDAQQDPSIQTRQQHRDKQLQQQQEMIKRQRKEAQAKTRAFFDSDKGLEFLAWLCFTTKCDAPTILGECMTTTGGTDVYRAGYAEGRRSVYYGVRGLLRADQVLKLEQEVLNVINAAKQGVEDVEG